MKTMQKGFTLIELMIVICPCTKTTFLNHKLPVLTVKFLLLKLPLKLL